MKVFISWSGELSKELGEVFRDWLPSVIQSVKPFFTPNDIEKDSRWSKDIAQELGITGSDSLNLSRLRSLELIRFSTTSQTKRDFSESDPVI
ncbi:hypothetical protein [Aliikangiella coralliicola]|uniref:TIR domain-containing protein n=1 Tax=Aliikangiella coralliicola TaxID=2592383 RepID=A0A545UJA0_9GAMM|nr:hypothetical protein [Aliikangiella coralliicola]TQV89535.1 hypothetical protein FLL46_01230 [Aliikangiella coralliicola]